MTSPWTPERTARLKHLAEVLKYTASECAVALMEEAATEGEDLTLTRNAIMGKCHRSGIILAHGGISLQRRTKRKLPTLVSSLLSKPEKPMPEPVEQRDESSFITLEMLDNSTCRWPMNDGKPVYLFCGRPEADLIGGEPYCPSCAARAFQARRAA